MLPDFTRVKTDLAEMLEALMRQLVRRHLGPLGRIPRVTLFEGGSQVLSRPSGEEEPTAFREIQVRFMVTDDEAPTMTFTSLVEKMNAAAEEIAKKMAADLYGTIHRAVEQVGNVVDAQGERFSARLILETLSRMQIDFGPNRAPRMPELHVHPDLSEAVDRAQRELSENPRLKRQFKQMLDEKREEWRAREASRRLVG